MIEPFIHHDDDPIFVTIEHAPNCPCDDCKAIRDKAS